MQMMREQGGPTPFEGPGRNVRAAPPIILPPSFRQDPRRLRRYYVSERFILQLFLFTLHLK